jgi:hypothetical protein
LAQGLGSLLEFEMSQILQDDGWHRHAQSRGKILNRHSVLLFRVRQKGNQAVSQVLGVAWLVKLDCQFFAVRHLTKIGKISAHDRDPVSTCQVRNSTASCGRRIGHDSDG